MLTAAVPTGVLLPAEDLSTPWFQFLAAFVAVNTLVYVGLTLMKLIRWPEQLRLDKARGDVAAHGQAAARDAQNGTAATENPDVMGNP